MRWFCFFVVLFYGVVRFETWSSVVSALSVTLGCVPVFELVHCFGEDSAAKFLSVVLFFFGGNSVDFLLACSQSDGH